MTDDPLHSLNTTGAHEYETRLAGHILVACGAYVDAETPVLSLTLAGAAPLEEAGIDADGSFTFHLEVWRANDGDTVVVVTNSGDEPNLLIDDASDIAADVQDLLRQVLTEDLLLTAIYLLEYEGTPILIWEHAS